MQDSSEQQLPVKANCVQERQLFGKCFQSLVIRSGLPILPTINPWCFECLNSSVWAQFRLSGIAHSPGKKNRARPMGPTREAGRAGEERCNEAVLLLLPPVLTDTSCICCASLFLLRDKIITYIAYIMQHFNKHIISH